MICPICKLIQVEGGCCSSCWELKRRIDSDPEFVLNLLNAAFQERSRNSTFSQDLRGAMLEFVAKLDAMGSVDWSTQDWVCLYLDGVRGLTTYSDIALMDEFLAHLHDPQVNEWNDSPVLSPEDWGELTRLPLWEKCMLGLLESQIPEGELMSYDLFQFRLSRRGFSDEDIDRFWENGVDVGASDPEAEIARIVAELGPRLKSLREGSD